MREAELVAKIRGLASAGHHERSLIQGIGDDCAILRPDATHDLVFTTDFVLENRHFTLETHSAADVGHLALARSLSDIAAMGAEPLFCLVSLAVPAQFAEEWIEQFYKGLLALGTRCKLELAGGDLSRFANVVANVTCCGHVPRGKAMLRSGAKAGDKIYVTGVLGASAHALASLAAKQQPASARALLRPEPRIRAGVALRRLGICAAMDLSDGLSLDLHRLCLESGVAAELDSDLPVAPAATVDEALHGGEDYELLFTASSKVWVPRAIDDIPVTCIGSILGGRPGRVRWNKRVLEPKGFDHFHEISR